MAGHSKWKNIQVRKGAQDAKKGKNFTKASKEVMLAAKAGGGDPAGNARLRAAIAAAKAVNLPKDKIELAIKKGTGELAGEAIEEVMYEGYAPGGVAVLVEAATDNRNRTVAEVRAIMSKNGGNMGEAGCVGWMFEAKAVFQVKKDGLDEEAAMELALEAGAEDVSDEGEVWEIRSAPSDFGVVSAALEAKGVALVESELTYVPKNTVPVDADTARRIFKMIDALEDNDDVQKVHANFDLPDDVLASM